MREISFVPCRRFSFWLNIVSLVLAFALGVALMHAQSSCSDGSGEDSLGCSGQQGVTPQSQDSPSTLNVVEHNQRQTPAADNSNEASASQSLSSGANFSDSSARRPLPKVDSSPAPPEPLTQFQRFVAATTGQTLPIFGATLFTTRHPSFAINDRGPAPGEMIIGPDDELRIRIWGQVNFSANLRVSREGEIYLPKVGAVHVAGLPFAAISDHLRTGMERVYRNFELSVDLGEIHTIQIYASGMVRQPGEYTVSALTTLVDAVFAVGGPSGSGSLRHAQVRRNGVVVSDFDLYGLLLDGNKSEDIALQPGDVIYIPAVGPQAAILGSVKQPAIFELRHNESIAQLLEETGGTTPDASAERISMDRIDEHLRRRAFTLNTDPASLSTPLADGDIVRIDPIISVYADGVTLRGAVASPGQFRWHSGMRLSELLPERDALIKRDYWWQRTRLGLPSPQLAQPTSSEPQQDKPASLASPSAQTNWNQAVIERLEPSSMTTRLIPFELGKLVLQHDPSQDLELRPGDVITVFAQQEIQPPVREQTVYVELAGEFVHPGIYSVSPRENLKSLVARAGGLTDEAYLYGAIFTRRSTQLLEQARLNDLAEQLDHQLTRSSLGASTASGNTAGQQSLALNHQMLDKLRATRATGRIVLNLPVQSNFTIQLPDMQLEDGDRLMVPFSPRTIQVFGAVYNTNAFLVQENARLGEYLRLAGGPNRDADQKRIYVLRADGSVIARDSMSALHQESFWNLRLNPGDSIMVPEKSIRPPALSYFMAWAQAISGTAITALEVNALK